MITICYSKVIRMKIGHFVIKFPSKREKVEVYGSERITHTLCKELSKMGHMIKVFVPFSKEFVEKQDSIIVYFYKSQFRIQSYNFSFNLLFDSIRHKLDVIHVHNDSPMAMIAGLRYAKKKKRPLVVTWHGDWLGATKIRKLFAFVLNKTLVKNCLSHADAIIVPSIEYVNESNVLGTYRDKIVEIPHGVDLEELKIPYSKEESKSTLKLDDDKIIVLYVSSVNKAKGAGLLLRAASKILADNKNVQFVFVGGGKVNEFRELARKLGISEHVKFTGYVDEKEKLLYYNSADIFVFPSMSKHEVFPVVTIESASFSLPIVVSDLRIFKNRIRDGYNEVYFKTGDENDLARAITYLLENEELRKRIGKNARKEVEKYYNSRRMAKLTCKLYQSLVES